MYGFDKMLQASEGTAKGLLLSCIFYCMKCMNVFYDSVDVNREIYTCNSVNDFTIITGMTFIKHIDKDYLQYMISDSLNKLSLKGLYLSKPFPLHPTPSVFLII